MVLPTYMGSFRTLNGNLAHVNDEEQRPRNDAPFDPVVHKDTKVVSQKRASDTQCPCRRHHQQLPCTHQRQRQHRAIWLW